MEIRTVEFCRTAVKASQAPGEWFPHLAVAGRSNVGKSSLVNWLFRKTVARVAKAPGKTRALNFFLVNSNLFLVDLPGYGYAKVSKQLREQWGRELGLYLAGDERLAGVVSLVDIRHGLTALDLQLQELLSSCGREPVVVLTKADKVSRGRAMRMRDEVKKKLGLSRPPMMVSVRTGDGRKELLERLFELVTQWREQQRGE